jgi:hypothetical protein
LIPLLLAILIWVATSAVASQHPPVDDKDLAAELTKRVWLTVWPNHVYNDSTVRFRLNARFPDKLQQQLIRRNEAGKWTMAFSWRLNIVKADSPSRVLQSVDLPLLKGDSEAAIDPSGLPEGLYRVQANIVMPDGATRRIWQDRGPPRNAPYSVERFLAVHHRPIQKIASSIVDASEILTRLRYLGNPGKAQFPGDGEKDTHGRSVWDLQLHDQNIYVGYGNGFWDLGPVHVYAFNADADSVSFNKEFRIDEGSVTTLVNDGERLIIPGNDATESWDFGNLYIKEKNAWRKLRTVPNAIHVSGAVTHGPGLVLTTGTRWGPTLYESEDAGISWTRHNAPAETDGRWDRRFSGIGKLEDGLLLAVEQEYFYFYKEGMFTRAITPVLPGVVSDRTRPTRITAFDGGLLYAADEWLERASPEPLYFIRSLNEGVSVVSVFEHRSVRDIVVRDDECYVLVSNRVENGYASEILTTSDLGLWKRVARFESKAMAYSLETVNGRYFVGMATLRDRNIQESGNIYELE